jgi:hypothetical protein
MRFVFLLFCLGICGCGDNRPPLVRSCDGMAVGPCAPFAYAEVDEASFLPDMLEVGDLNADAQVHLRLSTCAEASPVGHSVHIQALVTRASTFDDGGSSTMAFDVDSVYDDGTHGDAVAKDGMVDVTIPNPFTSVYPPNASVTLRFTPRASTACEGTSLEIPYRLGNRYEPPTT